MAKRYIAGRMVEVRDANTEAVLETLHPKPEPEPTRPPATYHQHLTRTEPGQGSNYYIACSCGWSVRLASISDLQAAEAALLHVRAAQPESIEALFDRL